MKQILSSDFSKNVFRLMTGTSISQMIPFLAMPILSRLFTPEEFGIYAFYISLVTLLTVFATGRYELAIPLPKNHKDAWVILMLSFLILTVFSFLLFMVIFIFNAHILALFNRPELKNWLYLIPVFVWFSGAYNIFTLWIHRMKMFAASGNSKVQLSLWESVVNLILGFKKNGISVSHLIKKIGGIFSKSHLVQSLSHITFSGLLFGRLIGLLAGNIYLLLKLKKTKPIEVRGLDQGDLKRIAIEFKDFPRINMLHAASDELKNSGLSFIILFFFMDRVLGIYNQAYRLLRAPLGIIGSAFGHVFFQEVVELSNAHKPISSLIFKTIKKLSIIALPLFILIFLFSPWFFTIFLGDKWSDVGVFAQYMTPWLFVNFIFSPVSQVALVIGKQFDFWIINLVSGTFVFLSIFLSGLIFKDIKIGLIFISISQILYSFYLYNWLQKISREHDSKNVKAT